MHRAGLVVSRIRAETIVDLDERKITRRWMLAVILALTLALPACGTSSSPETTAPLVTTAPSASTTSSIPAEPILGDNAYGPLKVGMTIDEAKATGWIGDEEVSCTEGLAGAPQPGISQWALHSPYPVKGFIDLMDYRVTSISVYPGANIAGVGHLGEGASWKQLASKLEQAGYQVDLTESLEVDDTLEISEPNGSKIRINVSDPEQLVAGVPFFPICE